MIFPLQRKASSAPNSSFEQLSRNYTTAQLKTARMSRDPMRPHNTNAHAVPTQPAGQSQSETTNRAWNDHQGVSDISLPTSAFQNYLGHPFEPQESASHDARHAGYGNAADSTSSWAGVAPETVLPGANDQYWNRQRLPASAGVQESVFGHIDPRLTVLNHQAALGRSDTTSMIVPTSLADLDHPPIEFNTPMRRTPAPWSNMPCHQGVSQHSVAHQARSDQLAMRPPLVEPNPLRESISPLLFSDSLHFQEEHQLTSPSESREHLDDARPPMDFYNQTVAFAPAVPNSVQGTHLDDARLPIDFYNQSSAFAPAVSNSVQGPYETHALPQTVMRSDASRPMSHSSDVSNSGHGHGNSDFPSFNTLSGAEVVSHDTRNAVVIALRPNPENATQAPPAEQDASDGWPCLHAPYGCPAVLKNVTEWKRHYMAIHLQIWRWCCNVGECNSIFRRADGFYAHLTGGVHMLPDNTKEERASLKATVEACKQPGDRPVFMGSCIFCPRTFEEREEVFDMRIFQERFHHIARHIREMRRLGIPPIHPSEWNFDPRHVQWMVQEGILEEEWLEWRKDDPVRLFYYIEEFPYGKPGLD